MDGIVCPPPIRKFTPYDLQWFDMMLNLGPISFRTDHREHTGLPMEWMRASGRMGRIM